jgi:glycerophosphoryl diester phosphodiesterase
MISKPHLLAQGSELNATNRHVVSFNNFHDSRSLMRIIGHRGCRNNQPENTIAAVTAAGPHVDMVEVDIQRCVSGEIVVFHDDTLDDLTDATGPVSQTTYSELSALTINDSDEHIPTLAELIDALPAGVGINVELKHTGMVGDVMPLVTDIDEQVIISSFEAEALKPVIDTSVPTAYLSMGSDGAVEKAAELGCEFIHPHHEKTDESLIDRAHASGLEVNAWTVPSESEARRLLTAGVDGVIVDTWEIIPEEH